MEVHDFQELMLEIRKISAWAELNRRILKWSAILVIPFMVVFFVLVFFSTQRTMRTARELTSWRPAPPAQRGIWGQVDALLAEGRLEGAIGAAERLVEKVPGYAAGHEKLGELYLAKGNLPNAADQYREAWRLFPSESYRQSVEAVERRIKAMEEAAAPPAPKPAPTPARKPAPRQANVEDGAGRLRPRKEEAMTIFFGPRPKAEPKVRNLIAATALLVVLAVGAAVVAQYDKLHEFHLVLVHGFELLLGGIIGVIVGEKAP